MNQEQEKYVGQREMVLEILKRGEPIDKARADSLEIGNLYSVIGNIEKKLGYPVVKKTEGTRNGLTEYYLASALPVPFEQSKTIYEPEEVVPEIAPEPPSVELRHHHVANLGDVEQILAAFRKYCEQQPIPGKRVPITQEWSRLLILLNRDIKDDKGHVFLKNRKVNPRKLEEFCEHFKENRNNPDLLYTTDGIGFDRAYKMIINGQTRMVASMLTGVTFYADVGFDFPPDIFNLIDMPVSGRKPGDLAYMMGVEEHSKLTAAVWGVLYRKDHGRDSSGVLPPFALVEAQTKYPDVAKSVKVAKVMKLKGSQAVYGAVHYLGSKINPHVTGLFFEKLSSGADLAEDSPILAARNKILDGYMDGNKKFTGGGGLTTFRCLVCAAWNDFVANKSVKRYSIDRVRIRNEWPSAPVKKSAKATEKVEK